MSLDKFTYALCNKINLIDVEFMDVPFNYNMLLTRNYIYAMDVVSLFLFHTMYFTDVEKVFIFN